MSDTVEARGLVFRGLGKIYKVLAPWGYTLMRFSAGAVVLYHGYAKLFAGFAPVVAKNILTPLGLPFPIVWAYFLGILELFGGAALAVGLLTRPGLFNALYKPPYERLMLGSIAAIQSASATLVTPFARAMLSA